MSENIQLEKNTNARKFICTLPSTAIVVLRDSWGDVITEKTVQALIKGDWVEPNDIVVWADKVENWSYDYSIAIASMGGVL